MGNMFADVYPQVFGSDRLPLKHAASEGGMPGVRRRGALRRAPYACAHGGSEGGLRVRRVRRHSGLTCRSRRGAARKQRPRGGAHGNATRHGDVHRPQDVHQEHRLPDAGAAAQSSSVAARLAGRFGRERRQNG